MGAKNITNPVLGVFDHVEQRSEVSFAMYDLPAELFEINVAKTGNPCAILDKILEFNYLETPSFPKATLGRRFFGIALNKSLKMPGF